MRHEKGLPGKFAAQQSPRYGQTRGRGKLRTVYAAMLALVYLAGATPALAQEIRIVAFGDSLTAGYGLAQEESFPSQLEAALHERGHDVEIVNAGVSGDTASAGLERLDWAVGEEADGVIVELGANDALRGIDPATTRRAMDEILSRLAQRDLEVLVAGMLAPPNLGTDYGEAFNTIFPELAAEHDMLLYPFFLEGVALDDSLNQADGLHPTAEGISVIVRNILPAVEELIARIEADGN